MCAAFRSDPIQFKTPSDRLSPPDRKSACCSCVRSFRFRSAVLSSCWREATYTYSNTYSYTYYRYAHARPLIFARRSVECEFIETPVLHSAHQIQYSAELENTSHYMCFCWNFCTVKFSPPALEVEVVKVPSARTRFSRHHMHSISRKSHESRVLVLRLRLQENLPVGLYSYSLVLLSTGKILVNEC